MLSHNGVYFSPEYEPHGVKLYYKGIAMDLTPEQEELATLYAFYLDTDHVKNEVFRKNFFKEFKRVLPSQLITSLDDCDFSEINRYLKEQRTNRLQNTSKRDKEMKREQLKLIEEKYGYAVVDGMSRKIVNYKIEPPGLFLGRGAHPLCGCLKKRIYPSDITLNIGEYEPIPPSPVPGHDWKQVIHNNKVPWIAHWQDSLTGMNKYVLISPITTNWVEY
eukprot:gene3090-3866_t